MLRRLKNVFSQVVMLQLYNAMVHPLLQYSINNL